MKRLAIALLLACSAFLPFTEAQPEKPVKPVPVNHKVYATGRRSPADLGHKRAFSVSTYADYLKHLPKITAPAYDCRTLGLVPPIVNQASCGSCFPEGTMIRMADGSERPIEAIRVNDLVVTAEGNIGRVAATMRRPVNENLLRLDAWGHSHMEATSEHPILTKRGYVRLGEIQEGDWVAFPKYAANMVSSIRTSGFVRKVNEKNPIPEDIRLTAGFGRLSGLFLAEGSTDRARIVWSFNATEQDTLAAEVVALVRSELGLDAEVTLTGKGTCAKVTVFGTRLAELFQSLYGTGAANKRLHPVLAGGTDEFLNGVLTGWMDGDRHRDESAVSISYVLALQMFDIANASDRMPALQTHTKARTDKAGIYHQHSWRVNLNDTVLYKRGSATQDQRHMWRKVRQVVPGKFLDGYVCNLEVEGDHSYVAEGVGVHNCWDFSGTCVVNCALIQAGYGPADGTFTLSEQYTLDCYSNGGCSGDDNTTVLDHAKSVGLPTAQQYGPYKGNAGQCGYQQSMKLYKISDWGFCTTTNTNAVANTQDIKNAMVKFGPIGSGVAADDAFMNNGAGKVFDRTTSTEIDHDIVLVGWDDSKGSKGAWLLRNSWGTSWCDSGYCWIGYGVNNVGTEAVWASATPIVPPNPFVLTPGPSCANPLPTKLTPTPVPPVQPAVTITLTQGQIDAVLSQARTTTEPPPAPAAPKKSDPTPAPTPEKK